MKKMNKKGFTLVELVIVIAVIAILAAVLIPVFGSVIDKANTSAAQQKANNALQIALAQNIDDSTGKVKDGKYQFYVDGKYLFECDVDNGNAGQLKLVKEISGEGTDTAITANDFGTEKNEKGTDVAVTLNDAAESDLESIKVVVKYAVDSTTTK